MMYNDDLQGHDNWVLSLRKKTWLWLCLGKSVCYFRKIYFSIICQQVER